MTRFKYYPKHDKYVLEQLNSSGIWEGVGTINFSRNNYDRCFGLENLVDLSIILDKLGAINVKL